MKSEEERTKELNDYLDKVEKNKPQSVEQLEEQFFAELYPSIVKMNKDRAETNNWGEGMDDPRSIPSAMYPSMRRKP